MHGLHETIPPPCVTFRAFRGYTRNLAYMISVRSPFDFTPSEAAGNT